MTHIQQRRDDAAIWASVNPVLFEGEAGHEIDTGRWKMGDGVTAWNDLPYKTGVDSVAGKTGVVTLVVGDVSGAAPKVSPVFTGSPKAPTPNTSDNGTSIATTGYVKAQGYAPVASPVFTGDPKAPTPALTDDDTTLATTAFVKAVLLAAHPVGDIKTTTNPLNPGTYIGGTWVAWGSGRVPVGIDPAQAEFDSVEETGGEKSHTLTIAEMPLHGHGVNDPQHAHTQAIDSTYNPASGGVAGRYADNNTGDNRAMAGMATAPAPTGITIQNNGGGGAHNNLQPYIVCYMWKRTA